MNNIETDEMLYDVQKLKNIVASYEEKYAGSVNDIFTYMYNSQLYAFFESNTPKVKKEMVKKAEKQIINSILQVLNFDYDKKNHAFISSVTGNVFRTDDKNRNIIENSNILNHTFKFMSGPKITYSDDSILWSRLYMAELYGSIKSFDNTHEPEFFEGINSYMMALKSYQEVKDNEESLGTQKQLVRA